MKIFSLVAIIVITVLWCACSDNGEDVGGASVEGNTVVAEVEIDSVFKMPNSSFAADDDTIGKVYWYEVAFHKRQELYYHYENEDGLGCYVNIYPDENGVKYVNDMLNHSMYYATLFIAQVENGILIHEQAYLGSLTERGWQDDLADFKQVCENRGGRFTCEKEGCPGGPPATCSTVVSSLGSTLDETLEQYAEEFKQLCEAYKK